MVKQALAAMVVVVGLVGSSCIGGQDSLRGSLEGETEDCTRTQGYWKNHPEAWPVDSLELGNVTYSKDELLAIFHTPVRGNGLVSLAHQLIAAKLNIAAGAPDGSIRDVIAAADALIGDLDVPQIGTDYLATSVTASLNEALTAFNEGTYAPDQCEAQEEPACGDGVVDMGEECDDGNTADGDGCSSVCTVEHVSVCGDGVVDMGETCDDGNNTDGDGCSSVCTVEPCCGDGTVDAGEECDDGNTTDGDGCSASCTVEHLPVCGDGVIDRGEECDDGNTVGGDGCSATCVHEHPVPEPDCIHELESVVR